MMYFPAKRGFLSCPLFILLIIFIIPASSLAASDFLSATFWWETEPFVGGVDYPQTEEDAVKLLLEEARWVFSGMIFGFSVDYTPPDASKEVEEVFEMELLGEIPWGERGLKVITGRRERTCHFADIGFNLAGINLLRREAWISNIHPQAEGRGTYTMYDGFSGRRKAVEEAVLQAIRGYYRQRFGTRPAAIHGEIAFFEAPYIIIKEGAYQARVRICMNLEVTGQGAF